MHGLAIMLPISFTITLFLLQWWQMPAYPLALWMTLGTGCVVAASGAAFSTRALRQAWLGVCLCCAGILLALWSIQHATQEGAPYPESDAAVDIRGTISGAPEQRAQYTVYAIQAEEIRTTKTGSWVPTDLHIRVTDPDRWPVYAAGSDVLVHGRLRPRAASGSFAAYLQLRGFDATIDYPHISAGSRPPRFVPLAWLYTLREHIEERIALLYPEPASALLVGLITGSRRDLPARVTEAFVRTSLTHIVAISGFNITIILTGVSGMLFFLPLRWRYIPSVAAVILFTIFVGASASVVRAAIMGILGLSALQGGHASYTRRSILWTCMIMLLWNPLQLWYDAGFQLSFLAVIGLTDVAPLLRPWLKFVPETLGIRETMCATLAAQCMAMPLVVYQFGVLSLISPIANLLIVPLVPAAMAIGAASILCSWIHLSLGLLIALPASVLLDAMVQGTTLFAAVPFAALDIPALQSVWLASMYGLLLLWLCIAHGLPQKLQQWVMDIFSMQKCIHATS